MANRTLVTKDDSLLTALGGTVNANDDVFLNKWGINFNPADLSASDLKSFTAGSEFDGEFSAAAGAQLTLVVNQTSTGIFTNESRSRRIELVSSSGSGVIYKIVHRPVAGGMLFVNTATANEFVQQGGQSILESGLTLTTHYQQGGTSIIRYGSTAITTLTLCMDAILDLYRDITNGYVEGSSTLRLMDTRVVPASIALRGGTLKIVECGTIAALTGCGTLDLTECRYPFTITTRTLEPGSIIIQRRGTNWMTLGSNADRFGGPKIVTVD